MHYSRVTNYIISLFVILSIILITATRIKFNLEQVDHIIELTSMSRRKLLNPLEKFQEFLGKYEIYLRNLDKSESRTQQVLLDKTSTHQDLNEGGIIPIENDSLKITNTEADYENLNSL